MVDEKRRSGDYEILNRLAIIEERQLERWQTTREILDRVSVLETRQSERWETFQREFKRIEGRLLDLDQMLKTSTRQITGGGGLLGSLGQDAKLMLAGALLLGAVLGKSGVNPLQWLFGG